MQKSETHGVVRGIKLRLIFGIGTLFGLACLENPKLVAVVEVTDIIGQGKVPMKSESGC